jgi:hypothetical protein
MSRSKYNEEFRASTVQLILNNNKSEPLANSTIIN